MIYINTNEYTNQLEHKIKKVIKNHNYVVRKLSKRTRSLWYASQVIADCNTEFGNDQEKIYEILKAVGESLYEDDKLKRVIKEEIEGDNIDGNKS